MALHRLIYTLPNIKKMKIMLKSPKILRGVKRNNAQKRSHSYRLVLL
jgi:hypothetical protein